MADAALVQNLVAKWVDRRPNACAVRDVTTGESLSYSALWRRSGVLAAALAASGVRQRTPVPVALGRSVELIIAFLGALRAGAAYMPLDSMAPEDRIQGMLDEVGSNLVLAHARHQWPNLPAGVQIMPVADVAGHDEAGRDVDPGLVSGLTDEDPVYVAYTSGSTGRPKGVVVPHRGVLRLVREPVFCTIDEGDQVANCCNPSFDVTTFEIWNTLTAGATIVVLPSVVTDLSIDTWVETARGEGISTMFLTTSLFHTIARERPDAFGYLRNMLVAGEQLELSVVRDVLASRPPRRLVNAYGPTEATTFASYFDCTPESLAGLDRVPIGYPIQETSLRILDEKLMPVAPGEVGELCIGGPGVASGYIGRPALTSAKFVTNPDSGEVLYRSGDMCRELLSGAIEYLGRGDRQVKLRGFRVELPEIERSAVSTGLADAAFVEKVGEGPSAMLIGFFLPTRAGAADSSDLAGRLNDALASRLPAYMVPTRWIAVDRLPVTSAGKADRAALLKLAGVPVPVPPHSGDRTQSDDGVTTELLGIWREVLGTADVGIADNFLDLGGNSLLAMQIVSRIGRRFGVEVEPVAVLLASSLGELAEHVKEAPLVAS